MRSIRHLTPRYIWSRLNEKQYQRRFPDHPWLTETANCILASYLRSTDVGLEFGSGRSTLWFAKRVQHLTSVEHDHTWHCRVSQLMTASHIENVDFHLIPDDVPPDSGNEARYVRVLDRFSANSLDFVLVDGKYRNFCSLAALGKLRTGGVLIIDDVNRYLPSEWTVPDTPDRRSAAQGPDGAIWAATYHSISSWRTIWTSSGVKDTALFFKPCS